MLLAKFCCCWWNIICDLSGNRYCMPGWSPAATLCPAYCVSRDAWVKEEKGFRSYLGLQLDRICRQVRNKYSEGNTIWGCGGFLTYNLNCQPLLALITASECIKTSTCLLRKLVKSPSWLEMSVSSTRAQKHQSGDRHKARRSIKIQQAPHFHMTVKQLNMWHQK